MDEVIRNKVTGIDYFAKVLTVMSGIALVLALTGMYSLMAYLAARRTREIGLRVALGATRRQVIWLTASRAGRIAIGGGIAGAALAVALGRVMQIGAVRADLAEPADCRHGRGDAGGGHGGRRLPARTPRGRARTPGWRCAPRLRARAADGGQRHPCRGGADIAAAACNV